MASEVTEVLDAIVPEIFTPYFQQMTAEKSQLIRANIISQDAAISQQLIGAGLTFNTPSWQDLNNDDDNVSSDIGSAAETKKITSSLETSVRLSRNQSWSSADLVSALAGSDPQEAIANRVGEYWSRRLQAVVIATVQGVYADNDAIPGGTEHIQFDLTNDIKGISYISGVTDFSAEAMIDTALTMGDSADELSAIMVHSIVFSRMQKNNLIDFIPDSNGVINIPTFLGRVVIVDDGMPNPAGAGAALTESGVYHSWLFSPGAIRWGAGTPKVPTETDRDILANNGGGEAVLVTRVEWAVHPVGHQYAGTAPNGGPSNATTINNLAHEDSWLRVFPERKQIKMARLITRES